MEHKSRFLMLMIWAMSFSPSSLENGGEVFFSLFLNIYPRTERLPIFVENLRLANKTSLETFCRTQIWNLKYLFSTIVLFFFNFLLLFSLFFPNSINYVIKAKYILLELKAPWLMSTISETYNNILELASILQNASFKTSKVERDYY